MTPTQAVAAGRSKLAHVDDPMREARTLLTHAAGLPRDKFHDLDDPLSARVVARFQAVLADRAAGKPLSRVLGHRDFWAHRFEIDDTVLDPRADTEALVARAFQLPWTRVLDLGTGSGCILLSLLAGRDETSGFGSDLSQHALTVARRNCAALGLGQRASFGQSDWYGDIAGRFDLIVSNPPYIAATEIADLAPEVRGYDPQIALSDGADGLTAYRAIARSAKDHLTPDGHLVVEIGWTQRDDVSAIFADAGLFPVTVTQDMEGRDRVLSAKLG